MEAKLKKKIALLTISSFIASVTPLVAVLAVKWGDYVQTPSDTVKLSVGAIIVLVLIMLKAMGKLKMPQKRVVLYLLMLALCYTLSAILNDILFLLAMATVGELIDMVAFQHFLKKARDELERERTSSAVSSKTEELLKRYLERGRAHED